ncbi:hypothetical protein MRX96_007086 [Rhipicephalus microplus]
MCSPRCFPSDDSEGSCSLARCRDANSRRWRRAQPQTASADNQNAPRQAESLFALVKRFLAGRDVTLSVRRRSRLPCRAVRDFRPPRIPSRSPNTRPIRWLAARPAMLPRGATFQISPRDRHP